MGQSQAMPALSAWRMGVTSMSEMTPRSVEKADKFQCQFCGKFSSCLLWLDDRCPWCDQRYDAVLAQEGDD
jgi:lipopolysaccharide biosynthesis regulator YciM